MPCVDFSCHSCVGSRMSRWICALFSTIFRLFVCVFITMYHAACKVEFHRFKRSYSADVFHIFYETMFFLCSVAAVLLPLLLLLVVSPVSTFLKIKNRLSVALSSPSQCVCPLPLARRCRHYCCCAAIPRWAIGRLCPRRCCCYYRLMV